MHLFLSKWKSFVYAYLTSIETDKFDAMHWIYEQFHAVLITINTSMNAY